MVEGIIVIGMLIIYAVLLFGIAVIGDLRATRFNHNKQKPIYDQIVLSLGPVIYTLSIAVYCTSWTYFGSVGRASVFGFDFLAVYIGPAAMFLFGMPILRKILRNAKHCGTTSIADFIATRYGKSQSVAALVTFIALIGTTPYLALQLKAIVSSLGVTLSPASFTGENALPVPF